MRVYILSLADNRDGEGLFVLKSADYLNKHVEGGLYEEDDDVEKSNDIIKLKAALITNFSREKLVRLQSVLNNKS